eukprot:gene14360-16946_t
MILDSNDLRHAIKSLTGTDVSDDFVSMMQKQLALYGDTQVDFTEFRESFMTMTRSLYPNVSMNGGCSSNPASPPPSPTMSSSSPVSTPPELVSPPNSPRGSDSSMSPISMSPPNIQIAMFEGPTFAKPNPISPRRLPASNGRARSSSVGKNAPKPQAAACVVFNDEQAIKPPSSSAASSPHMSSERRHPPAMLQRDTSHNDLYSTLMSLNNDEFEYNSVKKKKNKKSFKSSDYTTDDEGEDDQTTFQMEAEWEGPGKRKKKSKRYTYGRQESIKLATEEFYYDPELQLDDLHAVISILKEKYALSGSKVKELERKVARALDTNNQLEEELSVTKKECITMSLKNNALMQNKHMSDQIIEEHNNTISQLRQWKQTTERDVTTMRKRLACYEDTIAKHVKTIEEAQAEQELRESKHQHEIDQINQRHNHLINNKT